MSRKRLSDWPCLFALLCLAGLIAMASLVIACDPNGEDLYAHAVYNFTGDGQLPGDYNEDNGEIIAILPGTTVYFHGRRADGGLVDGRDWDVNNGQLAEDVATYYWDFDYNSGDDTTGIFTSHTFNGSPGTDFITRVHVIDGGTPQNDEDKPYVQAEEANAQIAFKLVVPDIDTDSDNNGTINSDDDPIEESYPGRYVQIGGELARVNTGCAPSVTGWKVVLNSSSSRIEVYSDPNGQSRITLPAEYTVGSEPNPVYVKGVSTTGTATLDLTYKPSSTGVGPKDTVRFNVGTSSPQPPLPSDDLNNAAGPDRCNVRWSNPDTAIAYADTFIIPTGYWTIDKIRMWVVPPVPVSPSYALGDHYSAITFYTGSTGSLSQRATGSLTVNSSTVSSLSPSGRTITCTPVTYPGGANYQQPDGTYNQIWQIDFGGLAWNVSGGTYRCGMYGAPRYDRLWFTHATYKSGGTNNFLPFTRSTGVVGTAVTGEGWFGKGSDLNIQVFYSPL